MHRKSCSGKQIYSLKKDFCQDFTHPLTRAMKYQTFLKVFLSTLLSFTPPVRTSPPGEIRFETLAGPDGCEGDDLFTIGFFGTNNHSCVSLAESSPTDFWLDWTLSNCSVNLFAEAGCPSASLVFTVPEPANLGEGGCANVEAGFRALNITCTAEPSSLF
ncbi:hypothetical protein NM688_g160 [Phlebia brevispora]|uniref:Uncharacterized protein n=1 Tax=Phlebia brevispora TaxID=194682 RepID=A0ACC1TF06_9APHY|nr:hypothetical protein NM688_g160 [Phlebia brevispora]